MLLPYSASQAHGQTLQKNKQPQKTVMFGSYVEIEVQPNGKTEYRAYPGACHPENTRPISQPIGILEQSAKEYKAVDAFGVTSSARFLEGQLKKLIEKEPDTYRQDPITQIRFLQPRYWKALGQSVPEIWASWRFKSFWNRQSSGPFAKSEYDIKDVENTVIGVDVGGRCSIRVRNFPYRIDRFSPITYYTQPFTGEKASAEGSFAPEKPSSEILPKLGEKVAERRFETIFGIWSNLFLESLIQGAGDAEQAKRYYRRHKIDTVSIALPASFDSDTITGADLLCIKSGVDWSGLDKQEMGKRLLPILRKTFEKAGFQNVLADDVSIHLLIDSAAGLLTEGTILGGGQLAAQSSERDKMFYFSSGSGIGGSNSAFQTGGMTLLFKPMNITPSSIGRNGTYDTDERPLEQKRRIGQQHIPGGIRKVQDYLSHYGLIKQAKWWEMSFPKGTHEDDKPRLIIEWAFNDEHPQHAKAKGIIDQGLKVLLKECASVIGSQNGNAHVILDGGILQGIEAHYQERDARLLQKGQTQNRRTYLSEELEARILRAVNKNETLLQNFPESVSDSEKIVLLLDWAVSDKQIEVQKEAKAILDKVIKGHLRRTFPVLQTQNLNGFTEEIRKALRIQQDEQQNGKNPNYVVGYSQERIHHLLDDDIADTVTFQLGKHPHNALGAAIYGVDEKCAEEQGEHGFRKIRIGK